MLSQINRSEWHGHDQPERVWKRILAASIDTIGIRPLALGEDASFHDKSAKSEMIDLDRNSCTITTTVHQSHDSYYKE